MTASAAEASLLKVALASRCPRCGKGSLYSGLLTVRNRCDVCGLDLSSEDTGDGASVFVVLILGAVVVLLGFVVDRMFQPPLWVHALLWIPFTIAGSVVLTRIAKAALIAQQYRLRGLGQGRGTE